jgi:inhibitor of KinA sporulation pathway (predicted exonuclease)
MKDIFNQETIEAFKVRIANISENSTAQWGKMDVYQMLKHCTENDKMMVRGPPVQAPVYR